MRTIAIAALIALSPVASALAQNKPATTKALATKPAAQMQPSASPKAQPDKRAKACAEYGVGFKPIEGTGTCVKIGGYVRMQSER
jgi:hypothetical protein